MSTQLHCVAIGGNKSVGHLSQDTQSHLGLGFSVAAVQLAVFNQKDALVFAIHSSCGRHFLGLRQGRRGGYEIVYEDADNGRRLVCKITRDDVDVASLSHQLETALQTNAALASLCAGLRSVEIDFEVYSEPCFTGRNFGLPLLGTLPNLGQNSG